MSSTKCRHVHTKDEICGDIVNMLRPSWLTSVPSNFGSASHGKLKADQWHVLLVTDILGFWGQTLDSSDDEDLLPIKLKSPSYPSDSLKDCIQGYLGYLSTSASTLSLLTVAGITYSVASKHSGNSCILLDSPSKTVFLPARIEHIIHTSSLHFC